MRRERRARAFAVALSAAGALALARPACADDPPPDSGSRIVGGYAAAAGSVPWQIEIYSTYPYTPADFAADDALPASQKRYLRARPPWDVTHICGGSYLGHWWVLTAAHCLKLSDDDEAAHVDVRTRRRVRLGTQNLGPGGGGTTYRIAGVFRHPCYDPSTHQHDLALIKLAADDATRVGDIVKLEPIALYGAQATDPPLPPNASVSATGWGWTAERTERSPPLFDAHGQMMQASAPLQQVDLNLLPLERCSAIAAYRDVLGGMLCVGANDGQSHDTCQGDSGGPLTRATSATHRALVGVVAWGIGCGIPGMPGLYTNVSSEEIRRWISAQMRGRPRPGTCVP